MFDFISNYMYTVDPNRLQRDTIVVTVETLDGRLYKTDMYYAAVNSAHLSIAGGWAGGPLLRLWKSVTRGHHSWHSGTNVRNTTLHFLRNRLRMDEELVGKGLPHMDDLLTVMLFDRYGQPLNLETAQLISKAANMFNAGGESREISATKIIWHLAKNTWAVKSCVTSWTWHGTAARPLSLLTNKYRTCHTCGPALMRPCVSGLLSTWVCPRITPPHGMYVDGHWIEGDTVVPVSTHTIHRDAAVFDDDPENFVPERWLGSDTNKMQR